ncbi:MAG: hypothetical protein E7394_02685 [Ruminococcaceae bacterium]|nr:hypothetical protein [Oscillospiraceae bacterium]
MDFAQRKNSEKFNGKITIAFAIYTSPPPTAEPLLEEKPLEGLDATNKSLASNYKKVKNQHEKH